jgi:predicted small lipoprotein YifL
VIAFRSPAPRRRACHPLALAALLALAACGCARKLPPTGGPLDVLPPELQATEPDSGATRIQPGQPVRIVFSEAMDRASVLANVLLEPGVRSLSARWRDAHTVELVPDPPLVGGRTYALLLASGPKDVRGNALAHGRVIHFATADSFPPGLVDGRGLPGSSVFVWAYRADLNRAPDSTAFDMDALGQSRTDGSFTLPGLAVPGTYRLWTFADRNRNRSFEPGVDLLTRSDSLVALTAQAPVARAVRVLAVDPLAMAPISGVVIDSLAPGAAPLRVEIRAVPVDTAIAADRLPVSTLDVHEGKFQGNLRAGRWRILAYRDLNNDGARSAGEPLSPPLEIDVKPGESLPPIRLVLSAAP